MKNRMSKKISLFDIAKSKFSDKSNLPFWYEKRLKICESCPLNSANKPKEEQTAKEKAWVAANLGKPTCLACKCEIAAKASLPHATCGLKTIGIEPKWTPIEEVKRTGNLVVENISTTPLKVSEKKGEIWLDYGTIKIGQDTDVQLLIKDINNNMTDIEVGTSCGCTESKVEKTGNEIILSIVYDTKRHGDFTKTVTFLYKQNNIKYKKIFKITGKTV